MAAPDDNGESLGDAPSAEPVEPQTKKAKYNMKKCPCCLKSVEACPKWCAETNNKAGKRVLHGPGCADCFRTYHVGNYDLWTTKKLGAFDLFCAECESDPSFREGFQTAMLILIGNAEPSFFKSKCTMLSNEGYKAYYRIEGLTMSQFKEEYNCSITDAGFRVPDLKDPFGNTFKGITRLKKDCPYVQYEYFGDFVSQRSDLKLPENAMLYDGQQDLVFDSMRSAGTKAGMGQRLRCCDVTHEQIQEKIAKKWGGAIGMIGANAEAGGFVASLPERRDDELGDISFDEDDELPARAAFPKLSGGSLAPKDGLSQAGGGDSSKKRCRAGGLGDSSPAPFHRQGSSPNLQSYFSPGRADSVHSEIGKGAKTAMTDQPKSFWNQKNSRRARPRPRLLQGFGQAEDRRGLPLRCQLLQKDGPYGGLGEVLRAQGRFGQDVCV